MSPLIETALALPTLLFTVPLGLACLYWLLLVAGAVDLDFLDGADGVDGLLEGSAEGAVDGALDGLLDGGAEAAGEAAADGAAEGITDLAPGGGALHGILAALQVGTVPVTVSMSLLSFFGWMMSAAAMLYVAPRLAAPVWAVGAGATGLALLGGVLLTSLAVKPLVPVFRSAPGRSNRTLVGQSCRVTTGKVTATFGQADVAADGDHLLVQVRCRQEGALKRGDEALIVNWDQEGEAFVVEPLTGRES